MFKVMREGFCYGAESPYLLGTFGLWNDLKFSQIYRSQSLSRWYPKVLCLSWWMQYRVITIDLRFLALTRSNSFFDDQFLNTKVDLSTARMFMTNVPHCVSEQRLPSLGSHPHGPLMNCQCQPERRIFFPGPCYQRGCEAMPFAMLLLRVYHLEDGDPGNLVLIVNKPFREFSSNDNP